MQSSDTWKRLADELRGYLATVGVDGSIVSENTIESVVLYPEEMTVENLGLLFEADDDQPVRSVLIGADANGHEYLAVDFYIEPHYIGRGIIVDNKLVKYQKYDHEWVDVEVNNG
ncbi:hypothetical protein [Weissella cibaria]|uniref:hypothetical protein n=1 Tax=Weissella cibaria TaxID=137591 RepID=UPI00189B5908|nr:hypothetical protein [Weissella cibaria]